MTDKIRNIAIVAHVDHGKTTLIDKMLEQSNTLASHGEYQERLLDTHDLERERGITILSKNTALRWGDYLINIVDTPGHADFGGEVERILSMVDSVLLLVDSVQGPMPQTRFVTQKAFNHGLNPIVVVNKVDRPHARPDWVVEQVFDLFDNLGATNEQLDFPVIYTSAVQGYATYDWHESSDTLKPLFESIVDYVPAPKVQPDEPLQFQISSLDYSTYTGAIGIGRITRGALKSNQTVKIINREGETRQGRVLQVYGYLGLQRVPVDSASAGDIVAITGVDNLRISDTICDPNHVEALPPLTVDEPTVAVRLQVNSSPKAGQDGQFLTSRQLDERLQKELVHNVALRVENTEDPEVFHLAGRGELHLSVLMETMRREGYEFAVSRPRVVYKTIDGVLHEPFESVSIDIDENHQGAIMEEMSQRQGQMQDMQPVGGGRIQLHYMIPSRGLIGLHTQFLTLTSGTGLIHHIFDHYGKALSKANVSERSKGAMISNCDGVTTAYALWNLQERGQLYIGPQTKVYEGMIIGISSRDDDMVVNPTKAKELTNVRSAGSDEKIQLEPPRELTLEQALEVINDDELVEVTPKTLRLRKKYLKEHERKRAKKG